MHIAEGAISGSLSGIAVLVGGGLLTAAATGLALRRLREEDIPRTALLSAAFFVASFVHVPFGVISFHLVLNGLVGLVLGWEAFPAILVALWFQAILFGYGGLTTLGINTFCMAAPAVVCYYLCRGWLLRGRSYTLAAGFLAGVVATVGGNLLVAGALAASGQAFVPMAAIAVVWGLVWAVVEGIVTAAAAAAIVRFRPEIFTSVQPPPAYSAVGREELSAPQVLPELCPTSQD